MKRIEDNRIPESKIIHPNVCDVGDFYKPWYFYERSSIGSPKDVNQITLVYRIENTALDSANVPATSFLKIPTGDSFDEYYSEDLVNSIKKNGQQEPIVCTKHSTINAPLDIGFLEDPTLTKIHCFEGHHRVVATKTLGIPVNASVYSLYHIEEPIDYSKHYNSIYDDSFWSSFQTQENRVPWFKENEFVQFEDSHKYENLKKCFDFIKTLNIPLTNGIDIGCAEGVYTAFSNSELNIPMTGTDMEHGRIIRGLLMRSKHNLNVDYKIAKWIDDDNHYEDYDFSMALSILHHMDDPNTFMSTMSKNKKVMIIEARAKDHVVSINSGSMTQMNTISYYENLFTEHKFNWKHISTQNGDRRFYVLWRK